MALAILAVAAALFGLANGDFTLFAAGVLFAALGLILDQL